jgi:uncharacterized membrane protein YfcA
MRTVVLVALVGLFAQLVDGCLGMAYGATTSTLLITTGVMPAAASAAVHLSEVGTTLVSGASHWRLGNTDWRTVGILALPGFVGAFAGAGLLSSVDGDIARPWVAILLLTLGVYVIYRFLALRGRRPRFAGRLSAWFLAPLGLVAGLVDAIGGGGWGPVGTTSLLASGRLEPRKVVGSVDTSEFVVAVGGSLGFLLALGHQGINWSYVAALMTGGVIAAPFAAWLVRLIPAGILGVAAGGLIVLTNTKTLAESLGATAVAMGALTTLVGIVSISMIMVSIAEERSRRALERAMDDSDQSFPLASAA